MDDMWFSVDICQRFRNQSSRVGVGRFPALLAPQSPRVLRISVVIDP